jgi:hypothetical protein
MGVDVGYLCGYGYGCASSILILILTSIQISVFELEAEGRFRTRTGRERKRTFSKSALNPTACWPNLKSEAMATQFFPVMAITLPPFISIGEPIVSCYS